MSGRIILVALLLVVGVACVDDNIPPRPSVSGSPGGAGGGSAGGGAGDGGVAGDGGGDDGGGADGGVDGGPVLLASSPNCGGMNLVVAAGTLFWTEAANGLVKSVPTSGGPPTVVASSQMRPGAIAVDATTIFWVAGDRKLINRKPIAGGNTSVFVQATAVPEILGGENDINALLVANNTLYFGRHIYASKIPTDGSTPKVISRSPEQDLGIPGAFALDATHLYQPEIFHNAISRELLDGTQVGLLKDGVTMQAFAPDRIAVSRAALVTDAIAIDDDYVVWANGTGIESKLANTLERQGSFSVIANSAAFNSITGFVISGAFIYLGESSADAVEVAPLVKASDLVSPPTAQVIATNQKDPGQFAADDQNIYWRTSDCRIMKLAK